MERGFLIHKTHTSTEAHMFNFLLAEIDKSLDKSERNDKRMTNGEVIQLQVLWESVKEMLGNEDLKERFYFDVVRIRKKIENLLELED